MRLNKLKLWCLAFTIMVVTSLPASSAHTIESYIKKYSDIATKEMLRTGIPASIKLSQGILESGFGNGDIAADAKNHFGIKCHNDWSGYTFWKYDDEDKPSCFRSYCSVEESYIDHSNFLLHRSRYAFLFRLDKMDYEAWAQGLQSAGYATAPDYADRLISLIHRYELYAYDLTMNEVSIIEKIPSPKPVFEYTQSVSTIELPKTQNQYEINETQEVVLLSASPVEKVIGGKATSEFFPKYFREGIFRNNSKKMIIAAAEDTPHSIAQAYDISLQDLMAYNDLEPKQALILHQYIYLEPKQSEFKGIRPVHKVKNEESMYIISQLYGVQLEVLLQRNKMKRGDEPATGQRIYLRGSSDVPPKLR